MVRSIEGIFKDGKVELLESPPSEQTARVIVTFLPSPGAADLGSRGISPTQAQDLRARLRSFEADWDRPDMGAYDEL